MAGGTGTYTLSGTGTITAGAVTVGGDGHGTFTQSGGTNKTGRLNLDSNVVGKATYTLTGGLLDASEEYIAYQGVDAFVHSGGTNKTNYLHLGINKELSTASYDLNGTGIITANYEYLGDGGTGIFTHTSGNNTANYLYLGYGTGSNGIYTLSGTGSLSTKQLFIGYADSTVSLFQQTGGTNTASMITIGASAKFQLTGGTLNIDNGTLLNKGEIDCTDSTATLTANGGILDFSKAILENVTGMSVTMGDKSLLILPANFDPYVGFGYFFSSGLVHHAGTTLVVPADKSVNVTGWLDDPVECYGTITLQGYDFKFNQGVVVKENGKLDLGTGYLYTNDGASGMTGGTITVGGHYVGYNGKGTFNQSGGTNTPSKGLCLGYNKADEGTYILSDTGTLTTSQSEYVGYSGAGTFTQKGGSNTTSQSLVVGYSGSGTYELQSGTMNAYNESVGEYSTGFFRQSGGTNTTSSLAVSSHNPSKGTYDMIAGTLSANYLTIGYLGEGTFNQSGGEVTVPNSLALGGYYEDNEWGTIIYIGKGTYNLTGGILNAKSIAKASSRGIAVFNFGGGTIRASGTFSSALPMTLTKIGGNANFDTNNFTATLSGVLSGVGGLNKLGANSLTLSAANDFSGDTTIVRGTLLLANAAALQNSTLDYNNYGGTVSFGSLSAVSLGGLKGNQNLSLQNNNSASVALSIGGNGQSTVYGGQLSGLGSLNKIGSGALILSGGNSYLGATTVTAGILNVDNASGSATGSGTVTVKSNATLSGSGFIAGEVVLLDGGFLSPGDGIGVLTVNNAVTLKSGSNFNIEVGGLNAGNSCDRLSASGPITLAGSLNLSFGNFIPTGQDIVFLIDNSTFSATVGEFQFPQDTKIGNYCGTDWYITYDANHAAVPSLHGGNDVAIYCVPEPATWILLSLAMSFLLVISLRQNRK
jgi:autotransporter-associated beta strand protein